MEVEEERRSSRIAEKGIRQGADILMGLRSAQPVFDSSMDSVDIYDPLTKLAKRIYGDDVITKWISDGKKVRDIWEKDIPKTQCINAIGPSDNYKCWLCGTEFYKELAALTPICEHILPIAQAVFFLELYSKSKPLHIIDSDIPEIIKLEYGWAHNICNAVKNDLIFIEQDPTKPEGVVRINKDAILNFVYKLKTTKSTLPGVEQVKGVLSNHAYYVRVMSDIQTRVNKVVDFINKPGRDQTNLLTLARTASFMDHTNIDKTFADMVNIPRTGGKTVKRTSKLKRTRRHKTK